MKRTMIRYIDKGILGGPSTIPQVMEDAFDRLSETISFGCGLTQDKARAHRKVRITLTIEEVKE